MITGGEVLGGAESGAEVVQHFVPELRPLVAGHVDGASVVADPIGPEGGGNFFRSFVSNRDESDVLGESVHHGQDPMEFGW